jgi:hypothetical protein
MKQKASKATYPGTYFMLFYSSAIKMEEICFSEPPADFQKTTQRYIPEDRTLHNQRCTAVITENPTCF